MLLTLMLAIVSLIASVVAGALGYGFSSVAVPLGLLVIGNRELNPAIVALEVPLNAYVLWTNRSALRGVWHRVTFVIVGLVPGVVVGTTVLAHVDPEPLRLATYLGLLPLVLLQTAGVRRAIRAERTAGVVFGGAVGAAYALTTISGPPLAVFLNNQGHTKQAFRAALGVVRLAESALAALLYARADLFTGRSPMILGAIAPAALVGVPLGAALIRRVPEEQFRRACAAFNTVVVALGASAMLRVLHVVDGAAAYLLFAAILVVEAIVLHRFFRTRVPLEAT